ncbi:multidrug transporter [Halobacteriales archaeon SW_6_65_46]|nr:MAG: multidrug transporter [Halobacteriales archaeon SW_6_65_46]
MALIFGRDTSTFGTVVGVVVAVIAIFGSTVLGWDWNQPGQFVPTIIGVLAAVAAAWPLIQHYRS